MMSSLNASFRPSASDCSRPNGPTRLGPGRTCIRATTRRSYQIANSVITHQEDEDDDDLDQRRSTTGRCRSRSSVGSCARRHDALPSSVIAGLRRCARTGATSAGDSHDRAGGRAERAPHGRAGRVGRQPDHAVGHLGDRGRQRDRAAVGADRDRVAVGDAERLGGAPCRAGPPAGGRCRPGTSSPSSRLPRSIRWCQVASTASPAAGAGAAAGATDRGGRPVRPASPAARRARGGSPSTSPVPSATPSCAASASSTRPSVIAVVSSTASNVRSRPSQSRKRAGLLDHRRDREDHVGPAAHRAAAAARG